MTGRTGHALGEPEAVLDSGKVLGVGVDLANVDLVRQAIMDFGERYLRRVFTTAELTYCLGQANPLAQFSTLFAAKEATIKALSLADGEAKPSWTSLELQPGEEGSWELRLSGPAAEMAASRGIDGFQVSISHTSDLAAAIVVATGAE